MYASQLIFNINLILGDASHYSVNPTTVMDDALLLGIYNFYSDFLVSFIHRSCSGLACVPAGALHPMKSVSARNMYENVWRSPNHKPCS